MEKFKLVFEKSASLRYGENPHQKAWVYKKRIKDPLAFFKFRQLQGKKLSFNNFLDIDAGVVCLSLIGLTKPAAVVIKHTNPCGAALDKNIYNAFKKAWAGDSLAAFGSIIVLNRTVDERLARLMLKDRFFELLCCPDVVKKALSVFKTKPNLRVLVNPALKKPEQEKDFDFKKIRGGVLVQEQDSLNLKLKDLKVVTKVKPSRLQLKNLLFSWQIAKVSKANCIVLSKTDALISSGVGQQDRLRCCKLAVSKAGKRASGCVAASDAFFPFPDGPEVLIQAGVKAIIQPGGSIKDKLTIELCNKHNIPMVFTGIRVFKH
jgi:phosphoribosylaminoimidazolecarboxamide formyltransferase / IMP cyclohydrolase